MLIEPRFVPVHNFNLPEKQREYQREMGLYWTSEFFSCSNCMSYEQDQKVSAIYVYTNSQHSTENTALKTVTLYYEPQQA